MHRKAKQLDAQSPTDIRAIPAFSWKLAIAIAWLLASQLQAQSPSSGSETAEKPEVKIASLSGTVRTNDGVPMSGVAVVVESAKPRSGPIQISMRCYPDCLKSAFTDAAGKFAIQNLDNRLLYRLRIGKQGYESKLLTDVDSEHGEITVRLSPAERVLAWRILTGQVLDSDSKPIPAALVIPRGSKSAMAASTGRWRKWRGFK